MKYYIFVYHFSQYLDRISFDLDGEGISKYFEVIQDRFDKPTCPNQNLYIGGFPEGAIKNRALERLRKNNKTVERNFIGCLKEMKTTNTIVDVEQV